MTLQQIVWASEHDWFIKIQGDLIKGGPRVVIVKDDMIEGNTLGFTDFDELKQWAGY